MDDRDDSNEIDDFVTLDVPGDSGDKNNSVDFADMGNDSMRRRGGAFHRKKGSTASASSD